MADSLIFHMVHEFISSGQVCFFQSGHFKRACSVSWLLCDRTVQTGLEKEGGGGGGIVWSMR